MKIQKRLPRGLKPTRGYPNINYLKQVILILNESPLLNYRSIKERVPEDPSKLKNALLFLVAIGVINYNLKSCVKSYYLNPEWLKLTDNKFI